MANKILAMAVHDKYGVVFVRNKDGSFNRNFRVSAAELRRVQRTPRAWPNGVTEEEWVSGQAVLLGKGMDVGDISVGDGTIKLKYDEKVLPSGEIVESFMTLAREDWSGVPPNITISPSKLASLPADLPIVAVENGVMKTK